MFIQTEATPNPATLKFLPGRSVLGDRTLELRDCNIAYAVEIMGAERAAAYLRRYYNDSQPDPRLVALWPTT